MRHGVPKIIYLQICEDSDCDIPYDDHDGITWCDHRINKTDVKYVLSRDKSQRTWVGLTDEERKTICEANNVYHDGLIEDIEAKLKEKNL